MKQTDKQIIKAKREEIERITNTFYRDRELVTSGAVTLSCEESIEHISNMLDDMMSTHNTTYVKIEELSIDKRYIRYTPVRYYSEEELLEFAIKDLKEHQEKVNKLLDNNQIMIENIEQLKEERKDLVESFENMSREELINQCYLECIDAINMEERVSLFMAECTNNMSNTTYTIDVLKELINDRKEDEINEFCSDLINMDEDDRYDEIFMRVNT